MCRLGLLSYNRDEDVTEFVKLATSYYGYGNNDGVGLAYVDAQGRTKVIKSPKEAIKFWLSPENQNLKIRTKALIMHTRLASSGEVKMENTHPFYDAKSGISFCHNGTAFGYEQLKKDLIAKGYAFEGQTDSEVLAKAYCEYGNEFTKMLNKYKVTGMITFLAIHKDGTIVAYTNSGSLKLWKNSKGITGFSDEAFFSDGEPMEVKQNTLYTMKDGKMLGVEKVEPVKRYVYSESTSIGNFGLGYGYQTGISHGHEGEHRQWDMKRRVWVWKKDKQKKREEEERLWEEREWEQDPVTKHWHWHPKKKEKDKEIRKEAKKIGEEEEGDEFDEDEELMRTNWARRRQERGY